MYFISLAFELFFRCSNFNGTALRIVQVKRRRQEIIITQDKCSITAAWYDQLCNTGLLATHAHTRYFMQKLRLNMGKISSDRVEAVEAAGDDIPETWEREGTSRVALAARCILEPPSAETESLSYSAMESPPSWSEKAISQQQLNHQVDHHLHCQHKSPCMVLNSGVNIPEEKTNTYLMKFLPEQREAR